jgi:hypothetical protein
VVKRFFADDFSIIKRPGKQHEQGQDAACVDNFDDGFYFFHCAALFVKSPPPDCYAWASRQ